MEFLKFIFKNKLHLNKILTDLNIKMCRAHGIYVVYIRGFLL
jgi:hypothetical protein